MFGDPDVSSPAAVSANSGNTVTTGSFTPAAGTVLVAHGWHDTAGGNVTNTSVITDSTGGTLAWTIRATHNRADSGGQNGQVQVSTAVVPPGGVGAITVTTTGTNTAGACGLSVAVQSGVDTSTPLDTTPAEGSNASSAISAVMSASVTNNTRAFLVATDWNVAANMTPGAGQTALLSQGIGAGPDMRIYLGTKNTLTTPVGTVETLSTAAPTTGNTVNWIAYALRPAAGGGASVTPTGLAVPAALGTPTLAQTMAVAPAGVAVPAMPGSPTVAQALVVAPAGVAVGVALGTPTVAQSLGVAPAGISVPVGVGTPTVIQGGVAPTGIAVPVVLGTPTVSQPMTVSPAGIAVPVALGSPTVGDAPAVPGVAWPPIVTSSHTRRIATYGTARRIDTSSGGTR